MNKLREDLDRRALRFTPDRNAYEVVIRRAARRRTARRVATGLTAFTIAVGGFVGLWAASRPAPRTPGGTSTSPAPELPEDGLRVAQEAIVGGWVVLPDRFGLWAAGAGTLFDVDLVSGEARRTATGAWDYDFVQLARHGEGTILLASGPTLWSLDARSGTVIAEVDLGRLGSLDAVLQAGSGTWVTAVTEVGGVLAEIELDSGKVLQRFAIGQGVHQLVQGGGHLFVASQEEGAAILRVDPRTGDTAPIHAGPGSIAVVGSNLWVASGDQVTCVDAILLTRCGEIAIPRAAELSADGRLVWVLSSTGSKDPSIYVPDPAQPATVTLLDGTTGAVLAGPLELAHPTPATISAFDGHAWIGFHDSGRVVQIDTCGSPTCGP